MTWRVGVIGLGLMGDVHTRAFQQHPNFSVTAICDPDPRRLNEVGDTQHVTHRYSDAFALITNEELDLLTIATPPRLHAPLTQAGFARGMHVLCEKPMAMSLAEAEAMLASAKAAGKVHILGHQSRFNPVRARIRNFLRDGFIGIPRHALYHHFSAGNAATRQWSWWSSREEGGGMLGEYASHQIDLLRWYFGPVVAAEGRVSVFQRERPACNGNMLAVTSDDYADVGLLFDEGVTARIMVSAASGSPSGPCLELHGSEGSLTLLADDRLIGVRGQEEAIDLSVPEDRPSLIGWGRNDTFTPAFQRLVEALAISLPSGDQPEDAADFEDGVDIQRVLDAARNNKAYMA